MRIEDLFDLYAYNSWANDRVRTSIKILTEDAFKEDLGGSFGSIQGTITHLVSAQWAWLKRWQGNSPNQSLQKDQFSTPKEGNSLWMEVDIDDVNPLSTHTRVKEIRGIKLINTVFLKYM